MIEKAISIALDAHKNQKDKAGKPYILHSLRVMLSLNSELEMICGILHDVIEDSSITLEGLRNEGFSDQVLDTLDVLSKRSEEDYDVYIERIIHNVMACKVKLADLKDNMNLSRMNYPTEEDYKRLEKYKKAYEKIHDRLSKTNCYELKNCPFNNTDPVQSKCPPHQKQVCCYEYDWVSYYKKMPDCEEKLKWRSFMLENCIHCEICNYHKDAIYGMLEHLRNA